MIDMCRTAIVPFALAAAAACTGAAPAPRGIDAADVCAYCRMVVSNARIAAQIVAPGEDARVYDDIGCAVNALKQGGLPDGAVVYVADYPTGRWIAAQAAVYARVESIETPMGSHLIAFADEQSRREESRASAGVPMTAADVFSGTRVADVRAR